MQGAVRYFLSSEPSVADFQEMYAIMDHQWFQFYKAYLNANVGFKTNM